MPIIRKCVHCGFCLATCPTYQLLGNELDSPRGRIQLISAALEGKEVSAKTQLHLDRCLTCRACETTCPSGVQYGRLLDIGRAHVEASVGRPWPCEFASPRSSRGVDDTGSACRARSHRALVVAAVAGEAEAQGAAAPSEPPRGRVQAIPARC